ncbi:uncharacterized protein LOC106175124 [Lingula anatina]|uniref:Uncharacterized protein LOC106175124 n=1 Tax=Lingula anatina TaxID=7574 RepID=A0A1S3JPZ2_LINAN|nr:uncharacterized protein LOC106175124 [Lingula anatina]XP_013412423.1 uncharacterized protein LOC106175124 [Lingula anatina]|eukprot:XP_013412422.1 uncharacterized protein LOC106175124 [Lingula anatina]
MSPGMSSANGHSIDLVYRVWVKTKDNKLAQMQSVLNKNYLVHQRLHTNYTPKTNPRILGIPAPIIQTYGGPQDPRVYHYAGSPWVIFNKFLPTNRTCEHKITNVALYTYNLDTHQIRRIRAMNGEFRCREKNWSPLIKDDKLFFIYSLEPTVLLHCKTNGECMFRQTSNSISKVNAGHQVLPLIRGSTQFVPYKWPYYVAIVHAKWTKTNVSPKSPLKYTNHMLLFNAESYEITFMSKDIQLRDDFLRSSVPVYRHIYYPFLYPVSLLVRDPDTLHVGLHHNDRDSVVMEISGVEEVLNTVIRLADERGRPAPRAARKYLAAMNPFM